MAAFGSCCLLCWLSMYFAVLGNILIKAMAICLDWHTALAVMPFLCCMSYLVERTRDYTSLFSGVDVSSSVAWAPVFFVHPYVRRLILFNTVDLLLGVWNLLWSWHKNKQLVKLTEKCASRQLIPG